MATERGSQREQPAANTLQLSICYYVLLNILFKMIIQLPPSISGASLAAPVCFGRLSCCPRLFRAPLFLPVGYPLSRRCGGSFLFRSPSFLPSPMQLPAIQPLFSCSPCHLAPQSSTRRLFFFCSPPCFFAAALASAGGSAAPLVLAMSFDTLSRYHGGSFFIRPPSFLPSPLHLPSARRLLFCLFGPHPFRRRT